MTLTPPIKYSGGKSYLARRIVALFPRHLHYCEPFAGGLAVLLERDPNDRSLWVSECSQCGGVSEVVNDLNAALTNFWKCLADPESFGEFARRVEALPLGRFAFDWAGGVLAEWGLRPWTSPRPCVVAAAAFFVAARQSRAGGFKGFTSLTRSRTRRGVNGNASEWLGAVEGLVAVHARLRPVVVENMDALKLIPREDTPDTLFYADPPYCHGTRASKDLYAHEMTDEGHHDLLCLLRKCKGKVILSGYRNPMYDGLLSQWRRVDIDIANHMAGGKEKGRETESLWTNYNPETGERI